MQLRARAGMIAESREDRRDAWILEVPQDSHCVRASLDVRTALDVSKPSVVSRIPTCMVSRGHVVAALLEGMQAVMVICFDNCGTEFRFA